MPAGDRGAAKAVRGENKVFLEVGGLPLVAHVVLALQDVPEVSAVWVVGDAERCFQKMKHYADLGVDQLICYVQFGFHSHESVMRTIEILGKEVLPELEKYEPHPQS